MSHVGAAARPDENGWLDAVGEGFAAGTLAPFLGPGLVALGGAAVPSSYEALAAHLGRKVALPRRARGNAWAAAQYIESARHRTTLVRLVVDAFAAGARPLPFHHHLARLRLPLIVDTWYDGAMRAALAGLRGWCEIQATSRVAIGEARWYRAYDPAGVEVVPEHASAAATLLYLPHGALHPAPSFLLSDADYVEVLTELDIQTPIPEEVRDRRRRLGFVFLGCRFNDQLLRSYARQIVKRSRGPHYFLVEPGAGLTRNEERFVAELGLRARSLPLGEALERLASAR